jgi:uncharacterized protein YecT (DUF1311 family)
MKRKSITAILLTTAMTIGILAGCGDEGANKPDATTQTTGSETQGSAEANGQSEDGTSSKDDSKEAAGDDAGTGEGQSGAGTSVKAGSPDSVLGEWKYMCTIYHSEDGEYDPYEYVTMCTDEMAPEGTVIIRKDGDKYLADYKFQEYEYYCMIYGAELSYKEEAPYDEAVDRPWCFEMDQPFEDGDNSNYKYSVNSDDELEVAIEYTSAPEDEYQYHSLTRHLYLRSDSPRFDKPEDLRYFDTVTVSNEVDLLNSMQNNRKIIVESGKYNFSTMDRSKVTNTRISENYGTLQVNGVSNLGIEAAPGAKVEFLIDEPYDPVMSFNNGGNITVRGLTCGHNVEPGYCSGSVLYFESISGVTVDKCNLYGSGTYGIETMYTSNINVTDTDIYECTYGLVSMTNGSSATFKNCTMRDSSELSMIYISSVYDVLFEDCTFSGNRADAYDTCYFVQLDEYDKATFRNCKFIDNKFYTFSNREVTLENCTSDNNQAGFADLLKASSTGGVPDKETILSSYDATKKRQEEIDNRFANGSLMDQQTMNQLAYEEYSNWDGLLNSIWTYLKENLDEEKMTSLTEEQQKWIREKEASMKEAGSDFEGGSMQPMIEYGTGASLTEKRVEELMNQYIKN